MDPGNMGPLGEWLPETIWPKLKSLERIKRFQNIGDAMQSDSDDWQVREEDSFIFILARHQGGFLLRRDGSLLVAVGVVVSKPVNRDNKP